MNDRLDHGRGLLNRCRRHRDYGRQRDRLGLAGEERLGEVREEPGQSECARQTAGGGQPDDKDGPVTGQLLISPLHQ
jgi:hypothetical protein